MLEPILHRIFQINVRDLVKSQSRLQETERVKMEQTKSYMQELLFYRDRERRGSQEIVDEMTGKRVKAKSMKWNVK